MANEKKTIRVAYLSYDGLTDPLGQSQILPYLLGLEKNGIEFVIFSFEKPQAFRESKHNIEKLIEGKKIKWHPLTYHKNPPVFSTVADVFVLWKAVSKAHDEIPFDILHCRSYITSLVGQRMRRKKGIKFIFDMRGFWADERVEGGIWNLKNPLFKIIYSFFKKKEKQFLTEADHVVSLTENAKEEILSWGLKVAPISVIPTCVDLELFDPKKIVKEDQQKLQAQLGLRENDFVLLYLGSWGTWYMTEEMLNFFSELKKQNPSAKFLIVSQDKIDLKVFNHKEDVIITKAPRTLVPLYISLAHASVFFIKPTYSKKASSATKLGELMAMNVPVVTNRGWGDVELMGVMDKDLTVDAFDASTFRQGIVRLLGGSQHNSKKVLGRLSLAFGILRYDQMFSEVLGGKPIDFMPNLS